MTDDAMERIVERVAAREPMPEDWREWASTDPAGHKPGCGCLASDTPYGPKCALELDAYNWRLNKRETVAGVLSALSPEDAADLAVAKGGMVAMPTDILDPEPLYRRVCRRTTGSEEEG